jgi:hypothetical protein
MASRPGASESVSPIATAEQSVIPPSTCLSRQALSLEGEETSEQKCYVEQPNGLILVERDRSSCYPHQILNK